MCISLFVWLMVFNTTFNNISVISWRSVLLVEETGVPGENHRPVASHWQILSHNVVHITLIEIRTHNISGDKHWIHIGSCKLRPRRPCNGCITGADPWGGVGGAPGARPPPKIGKNMIFWRKIVIFHTKYPQKFRASLRSAQIF